MFAVGVLFAARWILCFSPCLPARAGHYWTAFLLAEVMVLLNLLVRPGMIAAYLNKARTYGGADDLRHSMDPRLGWFRPLGIPLAICMGSHVNMVMLAIGVVVTLVAFAVHAAYLVFYEGEGPITPHRIYAVGTTALMLLVLFQACRGIGTTMVPVFVLGGAVVCYHNLRIVQRRERMGKTAF